MTRPGQRSIGSKIIFLLLVCSLFTALPCLAAENRLFTDMAGRKVELPARIDRIVCLGPGALRLIVYLNAQDKVVGIEELEKRFPTGRSYYMAHPELGKQKTVTPGGVAAINNKPNLEGVISVKPQVVFATHMQPTLADEVQDLLQIPVVVLDYGRFANFDKTVFKSLLLAGRILDQEKRAQQVVDFIQGNIKDLEARNQGAPKPKAYVGGVGFKGAHGLMSTDSDFTPFTWNQANNIAPKKGKRTHLFLGFEELIKLNPDFIFIDAGGLSLLAGDYAKKPDFYNLLKAFKTKQVYVLHPFNWYTTNICTALADAYQVGKLLNPVGFKDIDPGKKADEIYSFMVGKAVHAQMVKEFGPLGARPGFLQ